MASTNGTKKPTTTPPPAPADMRAYRAPSLLQPHRARDAIRDAHEGRIPPLKAYFVMLSSPGLVKVVAQLGYDVVLLDQEHSPMDISAMTQMAHDVQLVSEGRSMAWIRISGHDHAAIGYALDAGASIVVPQVGTAEDARRIVSATKFGKRINGTRSAPPGRFLHGFSDMTINSQLTLWENLNEQAAVIIQIESKGAVDNLDDILTESGEHIDAVWFGTLDCRASMSLPGAWGEEPEFLAVLDKVKKTLRKHDKPWAGLALGPPEVMTALGQGKAVAAVQADVYSIVKTAMDSLNQARELLPAVNMSRASKSAQT